MLRAYGPDTVLENCIFHISSMCEFSHSQGHSRRSGQGRHIHLLPNCARNRTLKQAARSDVKATTTIPIVFIASQDPVKLGLVSSIARPSSNSTGLNFLTSGHTPAGT